MKKQVISMLMPFLMMTMALCGCGNSDNSQELPEQTETSGKSETDGITASSQGESDMNGSSLITNGGVVIALNSLQHYTEEETAPAVYFLSDITPEAMVEIYQAFNGPLQET